MLVNTAVLTASGFIMRTVAVAFNVYLTNKIGAAGIGLFQLIMSVYGLSVTFASAGVKLATVRLTTDSLSGECGIIADIMRTCLRYGLLLGCCVGVILYFSADLIAVKWIVDARAAASLRVLAFSLPPVSMSACLSGYYTARRTAAKYAAVQLLEQLSRIAVTVLAISVLASKGLEFACVAISVGVSVSEAISFTLSVSTYSLDKMRLHRAELPHERLLRSMLRIAVPDAVGAQLRSVLLTIEHLLIPIGFDKSGSSRENSLAVYGTIHGMALPVILYPSALLTSVAGLLVPEIAAFNNSRGQKKIERIIDRSVHLTLLFSLGTAGIMYVFANEIAAAVYKSGDSAFYIRLLSILLPVMYLDMVVDGILKGLDEQIATMRYNIIDSAICVVLVYVLLPKYSVRGYIFIIFISEIINFYLSLGRMIKKSRVKINITRDIAKPLLCTLGTVSIIQIFMRAANTAVSESRLTAAWHIAAGAALYLFLLRLLGCIEDEDLQLMPRPLGKSNTMPAHRHRTQNSSGGSHAEHGDFVSASKKRSKPNRIS